MLTIAFTGGGTGGHIYPGLAVAEQLLRVYDVRIIWIGSSAPLDRKIVQDAGLEFFSIPSGKLRRYFSFKNILDIFKIIGGFFTALYLLRREKPALLFSKGGFVSVPPCAAACLLRIPVFTHESDYSPGLATKINTRFAEKIVLAYPDTLKWFSEQTAKKALVCGNPVRKAFYTGDASRGYEFLGVAATRPVLLVLGGSQGAAQVNSLIEELLPDLSSEWLVVHQRGAAHEQGPSESAFYKPYAYLKEELPDLVAAATLIVGRAGAGTVWESAAAGKPMLLIPLCGRGTRGDQVQNARWFAQNGAAISLEGDEANAERLCKEIQRFSSDPQFLQSMAAASKHLGELDAAGSIAQMIVDRTRKALQQAGNMTE